MIASKGCNEVFMPALIFCKEIVENNPSFPEIDKGRSKQKKKHFFSLGKNLYSFQIFILEVQIL